MCRSFSWKRLTVFCLAFCAGVFSFYFSDYTLSFIKIYSPEKTHKTDKSLIQERVKCVPNLENKENLSKKSKELDRLMKWISLLEKKLSKDRNLTEYEKEEIKFQIESLRLRIYISHIRAEANYTDLLYQQICGEIE